MEGQPRVWRSLAWLAIALPAVAVCGTDPFSPIERLDGMTVPFAALGSHTLLGQENGSGVSPAVTSPVTTQANGSSFVAFNAGFASNNAIPTDNKGNVWSAFGAPVVYRGYDGVFDVKAYVVLDGHGGTSHSVSIIKNGNASGELTLPFVEITNATELVDVANNYPPAGATATSGSVTTTGPATLVAFWWGDGGGLVHSATPDNGFTIIENFVLLPPNSAVQGVVAFRQVSGAGTYHVTWTQSPEEGAPLWLFAFQSGVDHIFGNGFD